MRKTPSRGPPVISEVKPRGAAAKEASLSAGRREGVSVVPLPGTIRGPLGPPRLTRASQARPGKERVKDRKSLARVGPRPRKRPRVAPRAAAARPAPGPRLRSPARSYEPATAAALPANGTRPSRTLEGQGATASAPAPRAAAERVTAAHAPGLGGVAIIPPAESTCYSVSNKRRAKRTPRTTGLSR